MDYSKAEITYIISITAGFGLLFALWQNGGADAGFFLILFLIMMTVLRRRRPKLKYTVFLDFTVCIACYGLWDYAPYTLAFPFFSAMYYGVYPAALMGLYLFFDFNPHLAAILCLSALCGLFLGLWEREYKTKFEMRDEAARKLYELEDLQEDIETAFIQVEKTAAVAERTRIARDLHDNAGHEIVAAQLSFVSLRKMLKSENAETLEIYDAALERLNNGMRKIRETAHNLQSVTPTGAEDLAETCRAFTFCKVDFIVYGDTSRVPVYVWNVLAACLNECLTNIARHSNAREAAVTVEAAKHIVRLCVENDGAAKAPYTMGIGLRNLRRRAAAVGGSLSVDAGRVFRVVCVVPIVTP